jgi:hypothetical protein
MDLVTHAIVGAATGSVFGRPVLGAVCAVLPDLVLGVRRRALPTQLYSVTHSLLFSVWLGITLAPLDNGVAGLCGALAVLSHIAIDLPTHGKDWAPPLFYPYSLKRYSFGVEWEFFNASWYKGAAISTIWVITCLLFKL